MSIIKQHIKQMAAYKPPLEGRNPEHQLLLDFNERSVPLPASLTNSIVSRLKERGFNTYPSYGNAVKRLANYAGVSADKLMLTNGSDQGIEVIIRACAAAAEHAIIPTPSFDMYRHAALCIPLEISSPPYSREGGYPTQSVLEAIGPNTRIIAIPNPNNPTGSAVSTEDILKVAKAAPHAAILVDECYFEYTDCTVKEWVADYPNICITRTFSKTWGIPCLRFGYVIAHQSIIAELLKVRGPYDVNQASVIAALEAINCPQYMEDYRREVLTSAKPLLESFLREKGIDFWPSTANFLFVDFEDSEQIQQHLIRRNILVRPKRNAEGKMNLRITIGTTEQMRTLIEALAEVIV